MSHKKVRTPISDKRKNPHVSNPFVLLTTHKLYYTQTHAHTHITLTHLELDKCRRCRCAKWEHVEAIYDSPYMTGKETLSPAASDKREDYKRERVRILQRKPLSPDGTSKISLYFSTEFFSSLRRKKKKKTKKKRWRGKRRSCRVVENEL